MFLMLKCGETLVSHYHYVTLIHHFVTDYPTLFTHPPPTPVTLLTHSTHPPPTPVTPLILSTHPPPTATPPHIPSTHPPPTPTTPPHIPSTHPPLTLHQVDDGWCEGMLNGVRGMFPDNFVQLRQPTPNKPPPPAAVPVTAPPEQPPNISRGRKFRSH